MKNFLFLPITLFLTLAFAGCAKNNHAQSPATAQKQTASSAQPAVASPAPTVQKAGSGALSVLEMAACRSVENKSPVGMGDKFPSSVGRIYVFTKVGLDSSQKTQIKHVWRFNGKEVANITLPVEGPQWRTYSSKKIDGTHKGDWQVDAVSGKDTILKSVSFKIE